MRAKRMPRESKPIIVLATTPKRVISLRNPSPNIPLMGFRYSFICQIRYLDQETAKRPFRFSSQAATCYYQSNHSKVEVIPLSVLLKDTTSELAGLSPH